MLAIGYLFKRKAWLKPETAAGMKTFVARVTLPAVIFGAFSAVRIDGTALVVFIAILATCLVTNPIIWAAVLGIASTVSGFSSVLSATGAGKAASTIGREGEESRYISATLSLNTLVTVCLLAGVTLIAQAGFPGKAAPR